MRHLPISSDLFVQNRARLVQKLLPGAVAIVNANDVLPTNADGSLALVPNSDLFYLSGIEQEESILLLYPDALDPKHREILFLRETSDDLRIWEGYKHTKDDARQISGIQTVKWLDDFPKIFRAVMSEAQNVYLNSNEHARAVPSIETRDDRFVRDVRQQWPLHHYHRLARVLQSLRLVKSPIEIELLKQAIEITKNGFERVARFTRPGVTEFEIEAEFTHEFVRSRAKFAYGPIIASGGNSCVLHYNNNDQTCKDGDVLLLDVAASYANYNADLTRTIPVGGRFTRRQRDVYDAVLRVMRASIKGATPGKLHRDWMRESQMMMNDELLRLSLITQDDINKAPYEEPACRKYYMHGLGHPLGLDVHDVGLMTQPIAPGWVLTVEPGVYIPAEGFGVRLENDILVGETSNTDLMAHIPVEAEEIEDLMHSR